MKKTLLLAATATLICGCSSTTYLNGLPYLNPQLGSPPVRTPFSIVNSTPYQLDVFIDGVPMTTNASPGQVIGVYRGAWETTTTVVVTAHSTKGELAGTATHVFFTQPEVWTVNWLSNPFGPPSNLPNAPDGTHP